MHLGRTSPHAAGTKVAATRSCYLHILRCRLAKGTSSHFINIGRAVVERRASNLGVMCSVPLKKRSEFCFLLNLSVQHSPTCVHFEKRQNKYADAPARTASAAGTCSKSRRRSSALRDTDRSSLGQASSSEAVLSRTRPRRHVSLVWHSWGTGEGVSARSAQLPHVRTRSGCLANYCFVIP